MKTRLRIFLYSCLFLTMWLHTVLAQNSPDQIELVPTKDVMVLSEGYRDRNFALDPQLLVGADRDGWIWHIYLYFDLSEVPSGKSVSEAILWLRPADSYEGQSSSFSIGVHSVLDQWEEESLVWANQPSRAPWSDFIITTSRTSLEPERVEVTEMVNAWLSKDSENFGFVLKSQDESRDIRKGYHSTNATNPELGPRLILVLSDKPNHKVPRVKVFPKDKGTNAIENGKVEPSMESFRGSLALWCENPRGQDCLATVKTLGVFSIGSKNMASKFIGQLEDQDPLCEVKEINILKKQLSTTFQIDDEHWDSYKSVVGLTRITVPNQHIGTSCRYFSQEPKQPVITLNGNVRKGKNYYLVRVWER